jgi:hypothetical protein
MRNRATLHIILACALGALACCSIAIATGYRIYFGLIAGPIVGYLAYDFRSVLTAIPAALRASSRKGAEALDTVCKTVRVYRAQPHPFFYSGVLIAAPFVGYAFFHWKMMIVVGTTLSVGEAVAIYVVANSFAVMALLEGAVIPTIPIMIFALIGARFGEKCYWWPFLMEETNADRTAAALEREGLRRMPLTYGNVGRWIAEGIGLTLLFFVWTAWKYLYLGIRAALPVIGSFLWTLFLVIHRYERVLCALDGTIGGVLAYVLLIRPDRTFTQNVLAVLFGMVLGAGFGVVNYEIFSKRVLKVVPVNAQ